MEPGELSSEPLQFVVSPQQAGTRLDVFLAAQFPIYSRVHLKKVVHAGGVKVDGQSVRSAYRLRADQRITVWLPPMPADGPEPENVPLDILYEDEHLAAINKPPHMVVHPAKGHWKGTLTAALAFHFQQLSDAGGAARPGVVHRLDRETSGVIVIAKTNRAHFDLSAQFEQRTTEKEYLALIAGCPDRDRDVIDAPIGVHPYQREKMAIRGSHSTSREARTFYEVQERFDGFGLLKVLPHTGRTHQIRLHLAHIGCPVLCDRQYGGRTRISRGEIRRVETDTTILLERHALHARRLKILHPVSHEPLEFTAPTPHDIQSVLDELREYRRP